MTATVPADEPIHPEELKTPPGHDWRHAMAVRVCCKCGTQKQVGKALFRTVDDKGIAGPWVTKALACNESVREAPAKRSGVTFVEKPIETVVQSTWVETD